MNYFDQFQEQLYAKVLYPTEVTELMRQADLWRQFCELPMEVKMKFAYPDHQIGRRDPGFKHRERAKGREDKFYFHFTGKSADLIAAYGLTAYVAENELLSKFFTYADTIYQKSQELSLEIAKDLDRHVPGLFEEVREGKDTMILRMLYYKPESPEDMSLADPHIDRGGYTFHLFESHEGLELLDFEENWIPAPMGEGHTITFAGWQLEQKSKQQIRATWHRVRRIPGVNDVEPRIAFVFFTPLEQTKWYPNDDRFQNVQPGY